MQSFNYMLSKTESRCLHKISRDASKHGGGIPSIKEAAI